MANIDGRSKMLHDFESSKRAIVKTSLIENIDKITKEYLVYCYFNIVHDIDEPKYFIGYIIDGDGFADMHWMFYGETIISNT